MRRIGFIFHFLNTNKDPVNTPTAIQFTLEAMLIAEVPRNVISNMVAAAEIISPSEADLKPFKASNT
ncbi:hypothetical protein GNF82_21770 [Clostridium perfringens]